MVATKVKTMEDLKGKSFQGSVILLEAQDALFCITTKVGFFAFARGSYESESDGRFEGEELSRRVILHHSQSRIRAR